MTSAQHIPVSALLAQSECIIRSLGPDKKTAQRLAQMGILPGTHLRIIRIAPLGGTIEVNDGQGQSFALLAKGQTYMIRDLRGGKTFQQRMVAAGLQEGDLIQVREAGVNPIQLHLVDTDRQVSLGKGEAKKIIVEVINHESNS